MKNILYIIIGFFLTNNISAQNLPEDLTKMNEAYDKSNTISMQIIYQVYFDGNTQPNQSEKGWIKKSKDKIYSNQFSQEIIVNDQYVLNVDNEGKMIQIEKKPKDYQVQNPISSIQTDSLIKTYELVKYKGTEGLLKHYYLKFKDGQVLSTEIWLNKSTFFIEKMKIIYRDKMEVADDVYSSVVAVINYKNIKVNETISSNTFSIENFINVSGKSVLLKDKYKNYELINLLN